MAPCQFLLMIDYDFLLCADGATSIADFWNRQVAALCHGLACSHAAFHGTTEQRALHHSSDSAHLTLPHRPLRFPCRRWNQVGMPCRAALCTPLPATQQLSAAQLTKPPNQIVPA